MKLKLYWLLIILLAATGVYSQTGIYYWSGKKKNYLNPDPGSVSIQMKKGEVAAGALAKVQQQYPAAQISTSAKSDRIRLKNAGDLQRLKNVLKNDPDIEFVLQDYTFENSPVGASNKIALQPKQEFSVEMIIKKYPGKLELVKSTKYNTHVLLSVNADETINLANAIYESGMVVYSHPDFVFEVKHTLVDPYYPNQYYLNNTGQGGIYSGIDINAPEAWALSKGCYNIIKVAVVDDGVEDHEDFQGRVLSGFTANDPIGNGQPYSGAAHGESVAGIIAATHDNDIGIKGVAPYVLIVPINIFNADATTSQRAEAIDWAWDEGQADVLNNSYTIVGPADAFALAIDRARTNGRSGKGCVIVAASGNDGTHVRFPANWPGVITVGACEAVSSPVGGLTYYSNRGEQMDLVAPSNLGDIYTTDRMGIKGYNEFGNYTPSFDGTSAACPQVSGAAALMLSVNPLLTEAQVSSILQQTATDMGTLGFDHYFGYGRLNVYAAVKKVINDMSLSITAPAYICTSDVISAPVLTQWPNVTWSVYPTTVASITPTGNTATITKTTNGHLTVTAVLTGTCGSITLTKDIEIGAIKPANICGPNYDICNDRRSTNNTGVFRVCEPQPGVTYNWQIDAGGTGNTGSGTSITVRGINHSIGYHDISVRANTPCGLSDWTTGTFRVISCGTGARESSLTLNLSPNPAKNVLTVKASTESPEANTGFTQLRIVDKLGRVHRTVSYPAGTKSATVNLGGIKPDLYTVLVYDGKEWITKQVVIE